MPIFRSAYDTTLGRRYSTEATKAAIVKATVSNYLAKNDDGYTIIEDATSMPVDIPNFTHPLYVEKSPYDGLFVDARPFVTRNRESGEIKVTSGHDYNLLKARAGLEHIWRTENPQLLRSASPYPASVYSQWLAENIQKRYGLEPEDQYKLTVFSAWFYYSLFDTDFVPEEREYLKIVQGISRSTKVTADKVMEVLDGQAYVKDVNDFCSRLEEVTGNVRLRGFSLITLLPILNSTWYGANSNEVVSVALEHIPTFFAVCMSALTERSFDRSALSKMAERVPAKSASNDFVLQMTAMLKS